MPTANVGALVGREREVELLARLLEGVRRGATETVVIEGEGMWRDSVRIRRRPVCWLPGGAMSAAPAPIGTAL